MHVKWCWHVLKSKIIQSFHVFWSEQKYMLPKIIQIDRGVHGNSAGHKLCTYILSVGNCYLHSKFSHIHLMTAQCLPIIKKNPTKITQSELTLSNHTAGIVSLQIRMPTNYGLKINQWIKTKEKHRTLWPSFSICCR